MVLSFPQILHFLVYLILSCNFTFNMYLHPESLLSSKLACPMIILNSACPQQKPWSLPLYLLPQWLPPLFSDCPTQKLVSHLWLLNHLYSTLTHTHFIFCPSWSLIDFTLKIYHICPFLSHSWYLCNRTSSFTWDYCNGFLTGFPYLQPCSLQVNLHFAARMILLIRRKCSLLI